jgi:hypothetical protein
MVLVIAARSALPHHDGRWYSVIVDPMFDSGAQKKTCTGVSNTPVHVCVSN